MKKLLLTFLFFPYLLSTNFSYVPPSYSMEVTSKQNMAKKKRHTFQKLAFENLDARLEKYAKDFIISSNFLPQDENTWFLPIPKQIHIVWVGGPIYKEYWDNIVKLVEIAKVSNYTVNIWVDSDDNVKFIKSNTYSSTNKTLNAQDTLKTTRNRHPNDQYDQLSQNSAFKVRNISDLRALDQKPSFMTDDEFKEYWKIIDSEMIGLVNFAAASDLLRYLILAKVGGIYLDTDVTVVTKLPSTKTPSQDLIGDIKPFLGFSSIEGNNGFFEVAPQHPIMVCSVLVSLQRTLDAASSKPKPLSKLEQKRRVEDLPIGMRPMLGGTFMKSWRMANTILFTGPNVTDKCTYLFQRSMNDTLGFSASYKLTQPRADSGDRFVNLKTVYKEWKSFDDHLNATFNDNPEFIETIYNFLQYLWKDERAYTLHRFLSYYLRNHEWYQDVNITNISKEVGDILAHLNLMSNGTDLIHIGGYLFVADAFAGTWHKGQNPPPFTTDAIKEKKRPLFLEDKGNMNSQKTD